ncbi:hypothetical protein HDU85_000731 [Gaertneriomyces sp. JEL0708]|nr:hypothetical protein HDU85_000731 [Gaertneriomyces sp. JEL0708]
MSQKLATKALDALLKRTGSKAKKAANTAPNGIEDASKTIKKVPPNRLTFRKNERQAVRKRKELENERTRMELMRDGAAVEEVDRTEVVQRTYKYFARRTQTDKAREVLRKVRL